MNDLLQQIEELAELYFTPEEIQIITDVDTSNLLSVKTPEGKAFAKGRLLGKVVVRRTLVEMAKNGSNDALKQLETIYLHTEAESKRSKHA